MKGHVDIETLALFSGGDLDARQRTSVGLHVNECPECRERVAEFRSIARQFEAFALEPSEDDLRFVREGIAREIASARPRQIGWMWWAVGAAAILLLLTFSLQRPVEREPQLVQAVSLPPMMLPEVPLVIHREKKRTPAAGLQKVSVVGNSLRLTTADPNIGILLPFNEGEKHEN